MKLMSEEIQLLRTTIEENNRTILILHENDNKALSQHQNEVKQELFDLCSTIKHLINTSSNLATQTTDKMHYKEEIFFDEMWETDVTDYKLYTKESNFNESLSQVKNKPWTKRRKLLQYSPQL